MMLKRGWILGLLLLILLSFIQDDAQAQAGLWRLHEVQLGETWRALSARFGLDVATLQQENGWINVQREPTAGGTVLVPEGIAMQNGRFLPATAGWLETAVRQNRSPWVVALQNEAAHPYEPVLPATIFVRGGDGPPLELPPRFGSLQLSHLPATPGQGIGFRAQALEGTAAAAWLGGDEMDMFGAENGRLQVGLTGTGAFFGSGEPELLIATADGAWAQPWRFFDGDNWVYQEITLTGAAAEINAESIAAERARLVMIWEQSSPEPQFSTPFTLPISDFLQYTSPYGARRSYNGGPYRSYHEGVDFSAYGETAVFAPAAGTVVVAEFLYVRGGSVIIDHGLGVYTGYYHLASIGVSAGQQVQPSDYLGGVGTTGLSTGNHLHWDLLVNGIWVDARAWHEQQMGCWVLVGLGRGCG